MEQTNNKYKSINMKKILLFFTTMLCVVAVQAQKEMNNWTFGYGAGLTWNTPRTFAVTPYSAAAAGISSLSGLPSSFVSSIATAEGCFTLSSATGVLLMYSDGMTIYDKNGGVMTNGTGMFGNSSSAQSGIIIPYPGHDNQYVAVSVGIHAGGIRSSTIAYSIVDMNANGGLGVVTATKNVVLTGARGRLGESVTAIRHANGKDYWIVAPGEGYPTYLNAWLLTASGVQSPVVSNTPFSTDETAITGGYFKFNASGAHFAWADTSSTIYFGDFNRSTGFFSNLKTMTGFGGTFGSYGVEFTPSGKYLYVSDSRYLYDFDFSAMQATTNPTIYNVPSKVFSIPDVGAVQLGPDNRLYIPIKYDSSLFIVDNPENFNSLKFFQTDSGFLSTGTDSSIGLPSFFASLIAIPTCYKPGVTTGTAEPIKTIISTLDRTAVPRNYSDPRAGSLILESKTRGMVLTRVTNPLTAIATPVEGMIVFDATDNVLKFYNGTIWKVLEQGCPDN
jgi:hypothetical protein